eukprot:TRINITY_DN2279_c0_g1_i5.p1 TRINITY_DN2279_c0_g1~~TRINITY_DN2279_c0_g1_i5.p1  ORF type:complete len:214 (+),score=50.23 TRINITY_DN2279_c0_g1_i5:73-714(+)
MARMSRTSKAILALLLGACLTTFLQSEPHDSFVQPNVSREAASAAAAAALLAAVAMPGAAEARAPTISVFGFGSGMSDAYSQNDNPTNPYSQFSDGTNAVYKLTQDILDKKKAELAKGFDAIEAAPGFIQAKNPMKLNTCLRGSAFYIKSDMEAISKGLAEDRSNAAFAKTREVAQKLGELGAHGRAKNWPQCDKDYAEVQSLISEWKRMVAF